MIIWSSDNGSGSTTWTPKFLNTFDDVVWHVSWSVTGNMLAVSGGDNKVTLWKETLEPNQWICISDVSKGQQQALNQAGEAAQPSQQQQPVQG